MLNAEAKQKVPDNELTLLTSHLFYRLVERPRVVEQRIKICHAGHVPLADVLIKTCSPVEHLDEVRAPVLLQQTTHLPVERRCVLEHAHAAAAAETLALPGNEGRSSQSGLVTRKLRI